MTLGWLSISLIIAAAQGLFLSISLWRKKRKRHPANLFLVALLMCLTVSLILRLTYAESNAIFMRFPHLTILGDFAIFLIGPAVYFYVKKLLIPGYALKQKHIHHLTPFFIFCVSFIYLLTLNRVELINLHINGSINPYYIIMLSSAIIQIVGYTILSLKEVDKYENRFCEEHSDIPQTRFLNILLMALLAIALCWVPGHLRSLVFGYDILISNFFYQVSFLLISLTIFFIAYQAIQSPEIFALPIKSKTVNKKYQNSTLTSTEANRIKSLLINHIEKERPFLEPGLSLPNLAGQIGVNHAHLSQVINEQLNKRFHELINEYRIQTFIEKAQSGEYENYTLLAIALESGFKTKASFNKSFKKIMGSTPSKYLKQNTSNGELSTKTGQHL